ncbi:diguanylate cyclase [Alteromonas lipolytica]|uniref:diguanylate cyclase n=1 Tax=Alteromonas lipolytica TaxID=1856405 RepID=UPI00227AA287|nr:diguanylate cyclase [Alteromonas lipolytica]
MGRIGGEEFLLVFPAGEKQAVKASLESFIQACGKLPSKLSQYDGLSVTFSIGLTNVDTRRELMASMTNADNLLYQAKAQGKRRVVDDETNQQ